MNRMTDPTVEQTILAQRQALQAAVRSGDALAAHLLGRGRLGSRLTAGNAALVLQACPAAEAAMSAEDWQNFGRGVRRGETGVATLTRAGGELALRYLFVPEQTYGNKPWSVPHLDEDTDGAAAALEGLRPLLPVPLTAAFDLAEPVRLTEKGDALLFRPGLPDAELLRILPGAAVRAYCGQYEPGLQNALGVLDFAAAVQTELCGRFGLTVPPEVLEQLDHFAASIPEPEVRARLEDVRAMSLPIGDCMAAALTRRRDAPPREDR